jgi:Zn-dependent peptidase ImmA (M78 family)
MASCDAVSLDRNRGAKRAREARAQLELHPLEPLPGLLDCVEQRAGLPVVVATLADDVAGACTSGPLLWVNGTQAAVRQRFTLAHELGHVWCAHDGHLAVDSFATLSGKTTTPHEVQANAFAAELLIPRAALERLLPERRDPTLDEVVVLAARYGTSALMTLYRLKQTGYASAACVAALAAAIDDGAHRTAFARLGCAPLEDRLGTLEQLPYLSAPLRAGRLAAVLRGDAEAEPELARAIGRLLR